MIDMLKKVEVKLPPDETVDVHGITSQVIHKHVVPHQGHELKVTDCSPKFVVIFCVTCNANVLEMGRQPK